MSRREAELEFLGLVASDPSMPPLKRAAAVLVIHSRREEGDCSCGWAKLGASFARHQAEELERVGLL